MFEINKINSLAHPMNKHILNRVNPGAARGLIGDWRINPIKLMVNNGDAIQSKIAIFGQDE